MRVDTRRRVTKGFDVERVAACVELWEVGSFSEQVWGDPRERGQQHRAIQPVLPFETRVFLEGTPRGRRGHVRSAEAHDLRLPDIGSPHDAGVVDPTLS